VTLTDGQELVVDNPPTCRRDRNSRHPRAVDEHIDYHSDRYIGAVMELVTTRRGEFRRMEYLGHHDDSQQSVAGEARVMLEYRLPLSEIWWTFTTR